MASSVRIEKNKNEKCDARDAPESMVDEEAVFGEIMSTVVADRLAERLELSFATNVHNLPMLRDPEPVLKRLKEAYILHVDLVEQLCSRRIFSISPFVSRKRREEVLRLLIPTDSAQRNIVAIDGDQQEKNLETKKTVAIQPIFADNENPPPVVTQKGNDDLQKELVALQRKLEKSKSQLRNLKNELKDLSKVNKLCKMATETSVTPIHDSMTALAMGASSLQQFEEKGRDYINKHKRLQEESNDETLVVDVQAPQRRKRSKMSREERYAEDFKQEGEVATISDLDECPHHRLLVEDYSTAK